MMKFHGKIGFEETVEVRKGVNKPQNIEKEYGGDIIRHTRRFDSSEKVNEDVSISNEISIVMDPYLETHLHFIRYIEWMGARWKVNSISIVPPRVNLTVGGIYNGTNGPLA